MASADIVINTVESFIGKGWFALLVMIAMCFSVNLMYISARGIKKLDAYFENGKDYDDTWSIAANLRFFKYCDRFILRKLTINDHDMLCWMFCNAVGYVTTFLLLFMAVAADIYLALFV